jgi:hypothetical protein
MLDTCQGGAEAISYEPLSCEYSVEGADSSEKAFLLDREKYPFCHVLSAGQVALYWTHDGFTRRQGEQVWGMVELFAKIDERGGNQKGRCRRSDS